MIVSFRATQSKITHVRKTQSVTTELVNCVERWGETSTLIASIIALFHPTRGGIKHLRKNCDTRAVMTSVIGKTKNREAYQTQIPIAFNHKLQ